MAIDPNQLAATLNQLAANQRILQQQLAEAKADNAKMRSELTSFLAVKKEVVTFREKKMAEAQAFHPKWYTVEFTVTAASTARQTQQVSVIQDGWFFIDRIYATWRETSTNRFRGPTSGGIISTVASASVSNTIDFVWYYQDGRTGIRRMDTDIPGDILFRTDHDGFLTGGGDPIGPNAPIQVTITPTRATGIAGLLTIIFQGIQCTNPLVV